MNNKYKLDWDLNSELLLDKDQFNEILKFHNKTLFSFHEKIENFGIDSNLSEWLEQNEFRQTVPQNYHKIIDLKKEIDNTVEVYKSLDYADLEKKVSFEEISNLLNKSFRFNEQGNKIYPSAGALYPVNIIVLIFDCNKIESISDNGAYLYDAVNQSLILYKKWDSEDISKFKKIMHCESQFLGHICIAYALDLRKTILKYEYRGYRHGLIEIGLMAQSLRLQAHNSKTFRERCWSGFSDNSLTKLCGLNVRNSPIIMTQWLGKI